MSPKMTEPTDVANPILAAIADLQMRLTYQDDDIKQLNLIVTRQQGELSRLQQAMNQLRARVAALPETHSETARAESPPPHY
ncbi:hypothetical protein Thivi_0444 [Thiocystis violascens DSM 198]|uniref:Protein SlyX homolog n=2 Tax=Thiocystis violascens TaxID=73141 RepID=I3Y693_THIV6|nr:hypothetical protein Thivi_0444 [Thiocystis violascens DSM 198]